MDESEMILSWRERRAKLNAVYQTQLIAEFDREGRVVSANSNFLRAYGYKADEIRGRSHAMFVRTADRNSTSYKGFWDSLRTGQCQSAAFRRVKKDGQDIWIEASYMPIFGGRGKVSKILKIATDVTSTTQQKIDYERQLHALNRSQCIAEFDLTGNILGANERFLSAFGYTLSEVAGRHHSLFVDEDTTASDGYRLFWQTLAEGRHQSAEYRRVGKGGREVVMQATYNPVILSCGKVSKIVEVATDRTLEARQHMMSVATERSLTKGLESIFTAVTNASRQAESAHEIAARVAEDLGSLLTDAGDLVTSIGDVTKKADRVFDILECAMADARDTSKKVEDLSSRAASIGQVVNLIRTVANQIDLLALNATIEAERAGDAGRGFAVVAQEVKALAYQTKQATGKIDEKISSVQNASSTTTAAIGTIGTTLASLNDVAGDIAVAIQLQRDFVRRMTESMMVTSASREASTSSLQKIYEATLTAYRSTEEIRLAALV